jgi:hypothetical protein
MFPPLMRSVLVYNHLTCLGREGSIEPMQLQIPFSSPPLLITCHRLKFDARYDPSRALALLGTATPSTPPRVLVSLGRSPGFMLHPSTLFPEFMRRRIVFVQAETYRLRSEENEATAQER